MLNVPPAISSGFNLLIRALLAKSFKEEVKPRGGINRGYGGLYLGDFDHMWLLENA